MGVGHVPEEPVRAEGEGAHLQGRQRRGTAQGRALAPHLAVGRAGEDLAARWYAQRGYEIVGRNWRWREGGAGRRIDGEVDIIAVGFGTVVFCEVKSRTDGRFGGPLAAVTPRKQERLRRLAVAWLAEHREPRGRLEVRFDVAAVVGGRLEVLEGAF